MNPVKSIVRALRRRIYLDYASLTPIDPRVRREMDRYSTSKYANPSSIYGEGVNAKKALEKGRLKVAQFLNAHSDEIVFASGGTEANSLALEGCGRAAFRNGNTKPHIVISAIEHSSIMETANILEKVGVEVTRLAVDEAGLISLDELKKALKPSTFLVSIMMVNNEIGTIEPIHEAMKIVRKARTAGSKYPLFHTDACQAALFSELNVEKLGIDLLTLDGAKVYGPRGIGALFVKRGTPIEATIYGGGQEKGLRSGTENVPAIMGFGKALELAREEREKETARLSKFKSVFLSAIQAIAKVSVNGSDHGSPHILNVNIPGIDNEFFVLQLDAAGVSCSTKSSCLRDSDDSYVLNAIGASSKSSVRFSFGRSTTKSQLKRALLAISHILC